VDRGTAADAGDVRAPTAVAQSAGKGSNQGDGARSRSEHVEGHHGGGQRVRLVLAGLPRRGLALELRQVPGNPARADFQGLA
jgi:hypothetical protein